MKHIFICLFVVSFVLGVSVQSHAENKSQKQEQKSGKMTEKPVQNNPFMSPYDPGKDAICKDAISQIAGKIGSSSSLVCDDVLWKKIVAAASEAGVLETVNKSAVVEKKALIDKLDGSENRCRPYFNNSIIPAPQLGLNMVNTIPERRILQITCLYDNVLELYIVNGADEIDKVTFSESNDAISVTSDQGKVLVISLIYGGEKKGVYKVWLIR